MVFSKSFCMYIHVPMYTYTYIYVYVQTCAMTHFDMCHDRCIEVDSFVCVHMYKVVCMVVNSMYALWHEAHTCYASLICSYHATSLNASWRTSE